MKKIILVTNYDDWGGLYVDGKLFTEGHSVTIQDALEAVGYKLETLEADIDWLADRGCLPNDLGDVKLS